MAELATAVVQAYEVEPIQTEQDVSNFVRKMKSVGLVEVLAAMAMGLKDQWRGMNWLQRALDSRPLRPDWRGDLEQLKLRCV